MLRPTRFLFNFSLALTIGATIGYADPGEKETRKLILQDAPASGVESVAVSPDGKIVATAAGEGGVRFYDAKTGEFLRGLGSVGDRSICFSPDGKTIAAGGFHMDKLVGLYDVATGKRVKTFAGQTEWEADACVISPDGKLLASTATDKQVLIWELDSGKLRHQLANQPFRLAALAFSPDSKTLAGGGGDKAVKLWDTSSGELRKTLVGQSDWICALAFSPDGKKIASGSCDWGFHRGHEWIRPNARGMEQSEWRLWDVESGKNLRTVPEYGQVLTIAFSPDGKSVVCGAGKEVRMYDIDVNTPAKVITTHDSSVRSIAFVPGGASLITGSSDQTARRIELATGKMEWCATGHFDMVNSVALSRDASLLVTGACDHRFSRLRLPLNALKVGPGSVRLWNMNTGRMVRRFGDPREQIIAVAITPDGRRIAAAGGSNGGKGLIRSWQADTGTPICSADDDASELISIAFDGDGKRLAAGSADGQVKIRDAQTGACLQTLDGHRRGATSVVFSPDGTLLYCGEGYGGVRVWDVATGRSVNALPASNEAADSFALDRLMNSIGLTSDGRTLATCASSIHNEFVDKVRIWDTATGTRLQEFAAHGRPMTISPDGSLLATGGKSVQLWDSRTGSKGHNLKGYLKRVQSITFSADGKTVVAGGSYGTVNAWETATGRHLVTLFAFSESPSGTPADEWFTYTNNGYYQGSPGADRYLAWQVGDEIQTPNQLGAQLNNPSEIVSALKLQTR